MKTRLKQWRRLGLGLMLTWALLFLALFSYFMESRVDETVALSHSETRRLTALQGNTHSIVVAVRSATPVPIPFSDQKLQQPASEPSQEDYIYSDVQNLAAWSAFGTQDVGSMSATVTRSRERQQIAQQEEDEDEGLEEVNDEVESIRTLKNEASNRVDSNPEDFYAYKSKSVVQHLWQGSANLDMLSPRLQKAVKVYLNSNKHGVLYKGKRHPELSSERVLCNMKKPKVKILDGSELPFSKLGWQKLVPTLPLEHLYGTGFGSCAVVTSAGAMLHSGLGKEIDSHDAVLRFNSAPTKGFERDVGNKTTIRIINSQILANPNYHFNVSSLYKNVTLVAWDPAPYTVNLHKWYENPDYNLFTPYTEYRRQFPDQPFYILHPKFIWQLWDMIQSNTVDDIQPNPPSSGFIGILLMMSLCERVDVYEYIPSHRQTDLCHYHERYYDAACTLGAYHPLLYEKVLVQRINTGTESDLQKGKVSLPGFSTLHCDPEL